jgi:hypothetical protein
MYRERFIDWRLNGATITKTMNGYRVRAMTAWGATMLNQVYETNTEAYRAMNEVLEGPIVEEGGEEDASR